MEAQASKILTYISSLEHTILEHPLWRDANDDEIDAVGEGLEKYVLTKLYPKCATISYFYLQFEVCSNSMQAMRRILS